MNNDISPDHVWVKYIYPFPLERTEMKKTESGQQLEVDIFRNEWLIPGLMEKVLRAEVVVFDPNYWGNVYKLKQHPPIEPIDTAKILRYMDAGSDTLYMVDETGSVTLYPFYRKPDFREVSGLFFMESWLLNIKESFFHKEILAYLPIRDQYKAGDEGLNLVKQRRLLFMVSPLLAGTAGKLLKKDQGEYQLVAEEISYELELYNRPYPDYLYRTEYKNNISLEEYEKWQYHHFDFYEFFNRDYFLEVILSAVAAGQLETRCPENPSESLGKDQRQMLASANPEEINSVIFHEDWYLDPGNLAIEKDVKSMVLVQHIADYDEYTGEYIRTRKVPLLRINFSRP